MCFGGGGRGLDTSIYAMSPLSMMAPVQQRYVSKLNIIQSERLHVPRRLSLLSGGITGGEKSREELVQSVCVISGCVGVTRVCVEKEQAGDRVKERKVDRTG